MPLGARRSLMKRIDISINMSDLAKELQQTVEMAVERLLTVPEPQTQIPKQVGQWTMKEILGHLIDSATNNHQERDCAW